MHTPTAYGEWSVCDHNGDNHSYVTGEKMNESQQKAMDIACAGYTLVLTGAIGTGKTTTLAAIIQALKANDKRVAVTASTVN